MRRSAPARRITALVVAMLGVTGAPAARPARVTSFPPEWPHSAPWKLNRELLLPDTERIVVVVDTPRGFQPKREALDSLASLAAKYGGREATWVRLGDPGAPNVDWTAPTERRAPVRVTANRPPDELSITQDVKDSIRYFSEVPSCPDGPLSARTSFVFVRYVGDWGSQYGAAERVLPDPSCGGREFPVIYLAQGRIARDRPPGMSQAFLERRALAHEYGHVLGLASNPSHGRWGRTVPYRSGPHCVNRECALAVPTARALLKGQMLDYCAACLHDIEQAREHWLTGKTFSEVLRLTQPDPAAHVARLKAYNFREGGEADRLLGYGKAVMPALMKRLSQLPGGRELSARTYAATLASRIIASEDDRRRGSDLSRLGPPGPGSDLSTELLAWWDEEGERFLRGDEWKLPSCLE